MWKRIVEAFKLATISSFTGASGCILFNMLLPSGSDTKDVVITPYQWFVYAIQYFAYIWSMGFSILLITAIVVYFLVDRRKTRKKKRE